MQTLLPVIFLPLLSAVLIRLSNGRLGKRTSAWAACLSVGTAFGFAVASFLDLSHFALPRVAVQPVFEFLTVGSFGAGFDLYLDPLSAVMICVVTGVGTLIHIYSTSYMEEETPYEYARYFSYLNFFIFSMLTLVLAANFLMMFIGWELVGVSSYLLIGYFRTKTSAADAGKKAFIVNRVGDLGFLIGIFILWSVFGTLDFDQILPNASRLGAGSALATGVALLLFMGAMGKSAQVPLHVWLPDAMEGPTPVSALIHAATMVTAGVFLVARCHAIFELSPTAMHCVAWIGAFTALFAASIALVQNDIKRVMAYSTLSQLGYMVMGVGIGAYTAGFFHLFTHAFFKALLFLGCGSVMHALHGELDLTKMGGLRTKLPITYWTFLVGSLCLAGFPLTSGFFSKDEILYQALTSSHGSAALWAVGTLTSALTAFYVFRLFFKTFHGPTRLDHHTFEHAHESAAPMAIPLVILAIASLAVGALGLPHFVTHWQPFAHWLEPVFADVVREQHADEGAGLALRLIAVYGVIVTAGIVLGWRWFARPNPQPQRVADAFSYLHQILWKKYFVDELYDRVFVKGTLGLSRQLWRVVDVGVIDGAVNALGWASQSAATFVRQRLHNGYARFYAAGLIFGVVLLLALSLKYAASAALAH